jgi:hypothetical protein
MWAAAKGYWSAEAPAAAADAATDAAAASTSGAAAGPGGAKGRAPSAAAAAAAAAGRTPAAAYPPGAYRPEWEQARFVTREQLKAEAFGAAVWALGFLGGPAFFAAEVDALLTLARCVAPADRLFF